MKLLSISTASASLLIFSGRVTSWIAVPRPHPGIVSSACGGPALWKPPASRSVPATCPLSSRQGLPLSKTRLHLVTESASSFLAKPVVGWVLLHVAGGLLGAPIVRTATQKPSGVDPKDAGLDGWYTRIKLPSWTPPNRLFGPVWTLLYASMGWSLHLVLQHPKVTTTRRQQLLLLWGVHYVSNLVWAPFFFGFKRLRAGLLINYWLATSLVLWMALIGHFCPPAAALLLPYLAWVVFATALNRAIVRRNPTTQGYNDAMFQSDLLQLRQRAARYADGEL